MNFALAFHGDSLIVVYRRGGKFHLMQLRFSLHIHLEILASKHLPTILIKSIKIRNRDCLVHVSRSLLRSMNTGDFDVCIWLMICAIEG